MGDLVCVDNYQSGMPLMSNGGDLPEASLLTEWESTVYTENAWFFSLDFWDEMTRVHPVLDVRLLTSVELFDELSMADYQVCVRHAASELRERVRLNDIELAYLEGAVEAAMDAFSMQYKDEWFDIPYFRYNVRTMDINHRFARYWRIFLLHLQAILLAHGVFDLPNGVHEVSYSDIISFFRVNKLISRPSCGRKLDCDYFVIKRDGNVMFVRQSKSNLCLLDGAKVVTLPKHDLSYYYDRLSSYANGIKAICSKYYNVMHCLSDELKSVGGDGRVHGCIVDINYYAHIYVNPFDGSMIPYFAYSISGRWIYKSLALLAKNEPLRSLSTGEDVSKQFLSLPSAKYPLLSMVGSREKGKRPVYDESQ